MGCTSLLVLIFISFCSLLGDIHAVLDLAKVADTLLFVLDPYEGWDSYGDFCLSCVFAQGLPSHGMWFQFPLAIRARRVMVSLSCVI